MQNLQFDDGYKSFTINDDPNKVVRFNPTDVGIIERINGAYKAIEEAEKQAGNISLNPDGSPTEKMEEAAEAVGKYREEINRVIDTIFNAPLAEMAFGKQSPLSLVGNGMFLWESFLGGVCKLIEAEMNVQIAAAKKRRSKYTKQVFHR